MSKSWGALLQPVFSQFPATLLITTQVDLIVEI